MSKESEERWLEILNVMNEIFKIDELKVTTGKIGIDLERILKINEETDPSIWKTEVDPKWVELFLYCDWLNL